MLDACPARYRYVSFYGDCYCCFAAGICCRFNTRISADRVDKDEIGAIEQAVGVIEQLIRRGRREVRE